MRKILLTTALFGLAALVFAAPAVPGKVTANILNMRIQPSLKSSVAGKVRAGQELVITSRKGLWLEVKATDAVKIFVDEAYISNGKTIRELTMYSAMSRRAAVYGKLPKGTAVQTTKQRAYGWVRILPPENLKVYVAASYVSYDSEALRKAMAEEKAKAAVKTEEKQVSAPAAPAAKAETKPEEKPEKPAAAKAAVKAETKPEVKTVKPAAKVEAKPEAKVEKPAAKPIIKAEVKPVTEVKKSAVKPAAEVKPVVKPAAIRANDPRVKALREYGIDATRETPRTVTFEGQLLRIPTSVNIATNYALGGDNRKNLGFICAEEDGMLTPFIDQRVKITGREFKIKGWKAPIIWLDEIDRVK